MPLLTLDLCIISADHLESVDPDGELFVTASLISGVGYQAQSAATCLAPAAANVTWNFPVSFEVDDELEGAELQFTISQMSLHWCDLTSEVIGDAKVSVRRLLEAASRSRLNSARVVDHPIRDGYGASIGELDFSFVISDADDTPPPEPRPDRPAMMQWIGGLHAAVRWVVAVALVMTARQVTEILKELAIEAISRVLAVFVIVGFLVSLPDLLRRIVGVDQTRWLRRIHHQQSPQAPSS